MKITDFLTIIKRKKCWNWFKIMPIREKKAWNNVMYFIFSNLFWEIMLLFISLGQKIELIFAEWPRQLQVTHNYFNPHHVLKSQT